MPLGPSTGRTGRSRAGRKLELQMNEARYPRVGGGRAHIYCLARMGARWPSPSPGADERDAEHVRAVRDLEVAVRDVVIADQAEAVDADRHGGIHADRGV